MLAMRRGRRTILSMLSRIELLRNEQLRARRSAALQASTRVIESLRARGIEAELVGSLKLGSFGLHSDVDFLVTKCPPDAIYTIEAEVEDAMEGLPFDLIYLELLPLEQRDAWLRNAR